MTSLGKDSSLLLCLTTEAPIDAADGFDLVSEALQDVKENYESDGIIGGRQLDVADEICVAERPGGSFIVRPRIDQLTTLMAAALGGGADTGWIPEPDGTLKDITIQVSHAASYFEDYTAFYVDELVISSEQNRPLQAEVTGHAKTCAEKATPIVPDYTNIKANSPILHSDLAITGGGGITGLKPFRFLVRLRNEIDPDGFANSVSRQFIEPAAFNAELELEASLDVAMAEAMAAAIVASPKTSLQCVATYTQGAKSMVINFQGVVTSPVPNIDSPGRQKYTLTMAGRAVWSGSPYALTTNMVEVILDMGVP